MPATDSEWSIPVLREVFADRAYTNEGNLVPRSEDYALYTEEQMIISHAREFSKRFL